MRTALVAGFLLSLALQPPSATGEELDLRKFQLTASIPSGDQWQVLMDGPLKGVDGSYAYALADPQRLKQVSIVIMPVPKDDPTFDAMKDGWERGFLKKATRKISSSDITFNRNPARKVIAALKTQDQPEVEIVGILVVANGNSYAITAASKDSVEKDPEIQKFIASVKITAKGK